MLIEILLSVAACLSLIVTILGCLNCFVRKKSNRFTTFQNPDRIEAPPAQQNAAFCGELDETTRPDQVEIEPLPEITVKTLPPLRPGIMCLEKGRQDGTFVALHTMQRSFPREHITYINEIGTGWFGQALESEALKICQGSPRSRVVVKVLKDGASKAEQKQFMSEVAPFRCLEHPNVLSLLGQCTETQPYLAILEYATQGNLKGFLLEHRQEVDSLVKSNRLVNIAKDVSSGVACLHKHSYIHCDLAARNCLVMTDWTAKVGDYGTSDSLFKDEYFQLDKDLLPLRWMAPESLIQTGQGSWQLQAWDDQSDLWSLGILLWEIFTMAELPYGMLTDEAVLQGVMIDHILQPAEINTKMPFLDQVSSLLHGCWKAPADRLSAEQVSLSLEQLSRERVDSIDVTSDFDQKWNHLVSNRPSSVMSAGSKTAMAGSFSGQGDSGNHTTVVSLPEDSINPVSDVSHVNVTGGDLNEVRHSLTSSPVEDKVHIENETVKPMVNGVSTPSKSGGSQTTMMTSTPVQKEQNSVSQFYSIQSSGSTEYLTASEGHGLETSDSTSTDLLESKSIELSLPLDSQSAGELLDNTLQETSQGFDNGNNSGNSLEGVMQVFDQIKNRPASLGDGDKQTAVSAEVAEMDKHGIIADGFGEFVRTSPTTPAPDFTEFAKASSETNSDMDFTDFVSNEILTDKATVPRKSPKDQSKDQRDTLSEGVDTSLSSFMVSSDAPAPADTAERTNLSESQEKSQDASMDKSFSPATTSSSSHEALAHSGAGLDASSSLDSQLLTSDFESRLLSESTNLTGPLDNSSMSDPVQNEDSSSQEKEVEAVQPVDGTIKEVMEEVNKLPTDSNFEGDLGVANHDAPLSLLSNPPSLISVEDAGKISALTTAFTELGEPRSDMDWPRPLSVATPSIPQVLEETRKDLASVLEEAKDPFSWNSVGLQGTEAADASANTSPSKVGNSSKHDSSSHSESGINSHSISDSHTATTTHSSNIQVTDSPNADATSCESSFTALEPIDLNLSPNGSLQLSNYHSNHNHLSPNSEICNLGDTTTLDTDNGLETEWGFQGATTKDSSTTSALDSGGEDSTDSSTDSSGQEYFLGDLDDTGQNSSLSESPVPGTYCPEASSQGAEENALLLATELYLSKGVNSPRVFEVPALETIPEDEPLSTVVTSERPPSDNSSLEVRYEDLFASDSYEWDDFFGDPLVSQDDNLDISAQESSREAEISDWSLDLDTESIRSNVETGSVHSNASYNSRQSDDNSIDTSTVSDLASATWHAPPTQAKLPRTELAFSDSEVSQAVTKPGAAAGGLVTRLLSRHGLITSPVHSPFAAANKGTFYSLMEGYDLDTDSEESSSPEAVVVSSPRESPSHRESSTCSPSSSSSQLPTLSPSSPLSSQSSLFQSAPHSKTSMMPNFASPYDPSYHAHKHVTSSLHCGLDLGLTPDPSMGSVGLREDSAEEADPGGDNLHPLPETSGVDLLMLESALHSGSDSMDQQTKMEDQVVLEGGPGPVAES